MSRIFPYTALATFWAGWDLVRPTLSGKVGGNFPDQDFIGRGKTPSNNYHSNPLIKPFL